MIIKKGDIIYLSARTMNCYFHPKMESSRSYLAFFAFVVIVGSTQQLELKHSKQANLEDRLVFGLSEYIKTGKESKELQVAFDDLTPVPLAFRSLATEVESAAICSLCLVGGRLLKDYIDNGGSKDLLLAAVTKLCTVARIETEEVCTGVVNLNADTIIYILEERRELTPEKLCSIIGQPYQCPAPPASEAEKWSINIPPYQDSTAIYGPVTNDEPISILQMSDIHFDDMYLPGGNAVCDQPLCCDSDQGAPKSDDEKAGFWGDYRNCDVPWHTVLSLMDNVRSHKVDYVYFTGDIIDHKVWATTRNKNEMNHRLIYNQFREAFNDTPLFPTFGNHEPHPLDLYAPTNITQEFSTIWLYNLMAELWSDWLPESALETVRKGGYYTVLVRPGFRVIVVNSNVGYVYDWWLLYDDKDPYGQLQWLADTLAQAEKDGETVHLLGHVPAGSDELYKPWSHQYGLIIQRFSHIIAAQFCGHTHSVQMHIFFNNSNINEPINIQFDAGSVTPFSNVNANYRLYTVNSNTYEIEDFEDWIFNLTEANQQPVNVLPRWYKEYSFKEAFGLESLKISEMGKFVQNLATNQTLLNRYFMYKYKSSDVYLEKGCDDDCNESNLCSIVTTEAFEKQICDQIIATYRSKSH